MPRASERSGLLQVRLRPNLYASVHMLAAEKEMTAAELVRRLIDGELDKHPRIRAAAKAAANAASNSVEAAGPTETENTERVAPKKRRGRPSRKTPSVEEIEAAMSALEERSSSEEPVEGEFVPQ